MCEAKSIDRGFHACNNLGVVDLNALVAIDSGAKNVALQGIVVNYRRTSDKSLGLEKFLMPSHLIGNKFSNFLLRTTCSSIQSGDVDVFNGSTPQDR